VGEQFGQPVNIDNLMDIKLRRQPDHEPSFASAAHSDTSNREIGNT